MFKKVVIDLLENGHYEVRVTKTFSPEHGGGEKTFVETAGPEIHRALDVAKGMVTVSPTYRTES